MRYSARFFELGFSYGWRDAHHAPSHGSGVYGSWEEFHGLPKQEGYGGEDFHNFYRGYLTAMKVARARWPWRTATYWWLLTKERWLTPREETYE